MQGGKGQQFIVNLLKDVKRRKKLNKNGEIEQDSSDGDSSDEEDPLHGSLKKSIKKH